MWKKGKQSRSGILVFSITLAAIGMVYLVSTFPEQNLSDLICQTSDLGERYVLDSSLPQVTSPHPDKEIEDSYSVFLSDHSLTYFALKCSMTKYESGAAAHRAFEEVCTDPLSEESPEVGEEACYQPSFPHSLTFRRDEFLVHLVGDYPLLRLIAKNVDKRIQER